MNSYTYTARGTPSAEPRAGGPLAVTFDAYGDQATARARSYGYDALGRLTSDNGSSGTALRLLLRRRGGAIASDGVSTYYVGPVGERAGGDRRGGRDAVAGRAGAGQRAR